ncbi:rhamnulokinase family protein [Companilactobacillus huachuanensis]|uniref:Rhamnulokinase family protein n=1 Tax=Companilactobacillus huachuanensis TaxID=2559914 RepID=A0ABW1RQ87_9LACO|nr:rhamnulokinase family protein [Companilactobacillus huachuanensis]
MTNVLAMDFGASSGRAIVGRYENGKIRLDEMYRFENVPIMFDDKLSWDINKLFSQIELGINKSLEKYKVTSLGIDTWGVDFGLIDEYGDLIGVPMHYRGVDTDKILARVSDFITLQDLYDSTGNQIMKINTLFQILSIREYYPDQYFRTRKILMISDLFNYMLTGKMATERSIASTTQLTNPYSKDWSRTTVDNFNINSQLLPNIVDEGNQLGYVKKSFNCGDIQVINVCQHDTASAVLSIPASGPFLFISCGTWSLVGTELNHPILNKKALEYNLTNESGFNKTTEFLKNCTGLWIVQELKRNYHEDGIELSYEEITKIVEDITAKTCLIDTDDDLFNEPGDMRKRISSYATETGQKIPQELGEFFKCAYESLAKKYNETIKEIEDATGESYQDIHVVGGGSKSDYFCQLIANVTHKNVLSGPAEATALGNVLMQLISLDEIENVAAARKIVANSVDIKRFEPLKSKLMEE